MTDPKALPGPDTEVVSQDVALTLAVCDAIGVDALHDIASEAGMTVDHLQSLIADPEVLQKLEASVSAARKTPDYLKSLARKTTTLMVSKIGAAVQSGEADLDDIDRLLPKVHRVLEHAETIELKRNVNTSLPVFNFNFSLGGIQASTEQDIPFAEEVQIATGKRRDATCTPDISRLDFIDSINATLSKETH